MQSRRVADDVFKHRCFDYLFTECNVLFSYFFFRPFAIFDIRSCAVPSCYVPLFIFEGSQAEQKAPKRAVVPQQSSFEFMRCPCEKSFLSFALKVFAIVRMNESTPSPLGGPFFHADAEILERGMICIEWSSIRSMYTDVLRHELQNLPKFCFLFLDSFFRNFALFDFYTRAVPFGDLAGFDALSVLTIKEPAIFPVSPPHARLAHQPFFGFKRSAPLANQCLHVFRMDCGGPAPPEQICYRDAEIFQPAAVKEIEFTIRQTGMNKRRSCIYEVSIFLLTGS